MIVINDYNEFDSREMNLNDESTKLLSEELYKINDYNRLYSTTIVFW